MSEERSDTCMRCNRRLRSPKSRELGYGPCCYRKMLAEQVTETKRENEVKTDK